jgi:hypothetical protein
MIEGSGVDYKWLFGQVVVFIATLYGVFRHQAVKMSAGHKDLHEKIDKVKDNYVRRDDYLHDLQDLNRKLEKMDDKLDELIKRR